ncbi:MAG TPA: cytochrome P450 [Actinophytocola sp.]|uniref:cytochrome P450 n=1 Tax=Actinophytocola sp. TaxID=1872138 RepID=UPI002DDD3654|nr:cytochrome P450 [Actinophytocola sp.]HEV2781799.1 cytochrome P450 [Actinophytocola sp.]
MGAIKGPTARAALGMIPTWRRDPLSMLSLLAREYGERVRVPFVTRNPVLLLSKPDDVAHVLVGNQGNYVKAPTYRPLKELLGNGLLTNEGEDWARQRRLVQPMFARRHVLGFAPAMVGAATGMLDGWQRRPDGAVLDVSREMGALALDVVGRALFSADLTGEAGELAPALTTVMEAYIKLVRSLLFWVVPNYERWRTPSRRRAELAEAHLRDVVDRIIARRRAEGAAGRPPDLLDMMLAARDEASGAAMSEQQVRDELMTFLLAGHETTANALAWTLYLLSTHPQARVRLEAEVDEVLTGRPPAAEDADKLEWTTAVVFESMRLYPPAWILERQAVAADELDGEPIPPGSVLVTPPYLVHRNPEHWPNPEGFDPSRFLPGAAATRHRYAYLPFGGGRRQCVGGGFATLEATLLLATISQRYRLNLVPGFTPTPQPTVTLRPAAGIPMTLHRR